MAVVQSAGTVVTIGSGVPARTSWGDQIKVADPGIPLNQYTPYGADPLTMWRTQPSLRKVVGFAARQIGAVPWHAYLRVSDTDRQRVQSSRAENLLGAPGRYMTGYQLWRNIAVDQMIYDLFCVIHLAATRNTPERLVRIPPNLLQIESDFLGEVTGIFLKAPSGLVDLTDAPLAISWGWHPDKASGISPLQTLAQILTESKRAVEWRNSLWENGPKVSGILKRPREAGKWDETKRERFLQSWRTWRDSAKAGGTPILEDGMDYQQMEPLVPNDAKDIEGRQLTDAEVASAFHIPPELVGARPGNFSNIAAFRQMLFGPTLGPLFAELQQAVNTGLVQSLDSTTGLYVEMNREAAIAGSFLEQAQLLSTMTGGPVMTRAEARAKLNLPFIEGTEELIVPLNVTEGGLASPNDTGSQNEKPDAEPVNPDPGN